MFELRNTSKSRCLGVRVEAQANGEKFRSIRGRQAIVNALIGNEHYPTMRRLRISVRLSVTKIEWCRTQSENWTLYLLTHMITICLQLPSSSSHNNSSAILDQWLRRDCDRVTWLLWRRRFQKVPFSLSTLTHSFSVEGRPIRIKKVAFSNLSGLVWTQPLIWIDFGRFGASKQKNCAKNIFWFIELKQYFCN